MILKSAFTKYTYPYLVMKSIFPLSCLFFGETNYYYFTWNRQRVIFSCFSSHPYVNLFISSCILLERLLFALRNMFVIVISGSFEIDKMENAFHDMCEYFLFLFRLYEPSFTNNQKNWCGCGIKRSSSLTLSIFSPCESL
jgi:hypothetical protein